MYFLLFCLFVCYLLFYFLCLFACFNNLHRLFVFVSSFCFSFCFCFVVFIKSNQIYSLCFIHEFKIDRCKGNAKLIFGFRECCTLTMNFVNVFAFFLKKYNTLVTSKICFLKGSILMNLTAALECHWFKWLLIKTGRILIFHTLFTVPSQPWSLL